MRGFEINTTRVIKEKKLVTASKINSKYSVIILIILIINFTLDTNAQDSINIKTEYTTLELIEEYQDSLMTIDTLLYLFSQYDAANNFKNFYTNTGNIGSPYQNLIIDTRKNLGFDLGLHHFDAYKLTSRNIKYYDTYTPYTELNYVQGATEMQSLKVLHSRNINPFWNVTLSYKSFLSDGFYNNQKNDLKNLAVSSNYKTRNDRYRLLVSAISNKFTVNENGGLENDSLFEAYSNSQKTGSGMKLDLAKQEFKQKQFAFTQILNLGKSIKETDTITGKITRSAVAGKPFNFQHNFEYTELKYKYTDQNPDSLYYQNIFLDSVNTNDQIKFSKLSNTLFFSNSAKDTGDSALKVLNFRFGATYDVGNIGQNTIDSSYFNLGSFLILSKKFGRSEVIFDLNYIITGNNKNDYYLHEYYRFNVWKDNILQLGGSQQRKSPNYIYSQVYSNHLRWNNYFEPVEIYTFYTSASNSKNDLFLKISYNLLNNWIYFSKEIVPVQANEEIGYFLVEGRKDLKLGNFHFNNNLVYQYVSNSNIIKLPYWMVNSLFYYENRLFDSNLHMQIGIDAKVRDDYIANSYFAPFSIFYLQNRSLLGVYPVINVFVNFSIKKLRIFFRYQHVNQGIPNNKYYSLPHYPYDPRVFRFGFSWKFFD